MTPAELAMEQLHIVRENGSPRIVAKSEGVVFAWEDAALQQSVRFGSQPADVPCPEALYALSLIADRVVVVQVAEGERHLDFHFLILSRTLYTALGDPFAIAARYPMNENVRGSLPQLIWPMEPLPPRQVLELHELYKAGDIPLLLGCTQALVDGCKILVKRPEPSRELVRTLWQFLPDRSRAELWPRTVAFSAELGFDIAVLPALPERLPTRYLSESQVLDYPAGRYELALQIAIENKNQPELTQLLARRSSSDTLRLALIMVAIAGAIAIINRLFL